MTDKPEQSTTVIHEEATTVEPKEAMAEKPKNMQRTYFLRQLIASIVMVLLGVALVAGVGMLPEKAKEEPKSERNIVNIEVMRVNPPETLPDMFSLPGSVEPDATVHVAAEVAGRIASVDCTEGRPCEKGDLLLEINRDLYEADVARAEAQLQLDQYELEAFTELHARGTETDFTLNQARAKVAASKALLRAVRINLDRTRIVAPVGGVLNEILVEAGEYIAPGDPVAQIVEMNRVRVVVHIPEKDIAYFKVGDEVQVSLPLMPSSEVRVGRIDYISELADPAARTTRIEILVDNRDRVFRSGAIVQARMTRRILTRPIMIPLRAVIPEENGPIVYVYEDGRAERRKVELGLLKGQDVRVLSGLTKGDRLIVEGHRYVGPGQAVRIVGDDPTTQPTQTATQPSSELEPGEATAIEQRGAEKVGT